MMWSIYNVQHVEIQDLDSRGRRRKREGKAQREREMLIEFSFLYVSCFNEAKEYIIEIV